MPLVKGRVLDLGCGTASMYKGTHVELLGVDFSLNALTEAKKNYPEGIFLQADITKRLPFPDKSFDTALLAGVLDWFYDSDAILKEARRVTKGKVLATLLNGFRGHDWSSYRHLIGNWHIMIL